MLSFSRAAMMRGSSVFTKRIRFFLNPFQARPGSKCGKSDGTNHKKSGAEAPQCSLENEYVPNHQGTIQIVSEPSMGVPSKSSQVSVASD